MAFPDEDEDTAPLPGLYWGLVTKNDDPDRRGRIKVHIPGLLEETDWVFVCMLGQGAPRRGAFAVPPVGAVAVVGFILGDVEEPVVLGTITAPDPQSREVWAGVPVAEVPNVMCFTLGRYSIVINDNPNAPSLYLRDESVDIGGGADACVLAFDGLHRAVTVSGQVAVTVSSLGAVTVSGARVQVQDRVVMISGQTI